MSVDILRVESNERVDLADFAFVSESVQAHERQVVDDFFCDPARTRKWIVSGFAMSNPAAKQLQVDKGKAILAMRIGGAVQYGVLTTEGDASLIVDLNSYSPGTYGIYIRFERIAGEYQSRIFWNPAGDGSEYAEAINTRYTAGWSMRVESSNPGDDWLKIGEVAQATMTITDLREFYFEGAVADSYESGWSSEGGGVANDRNADRALYGVTDLQMFTAAMRQCITDLRGRGLKEWYEKGIGGMCIGFDTDPVQDVLAVKDANFNLTGSTTQPKIYFDDTDSFSYTRSADRLDLVIGGSSIHVWDGDEYSPNADLGVTLGQVAKRFANVYAKVITPSTTDGDGCGDNWNPTTDGDKNLGSTTREWNNIYIDGTAFIDKISLSTTNAEGMSSDFFPALDNSFCLGDSASGLGSGSNYRFETLYLSDGWQVENASTLYLNMYCGIGPSDEKWWQFKMDNGGVFSLMALDDSYANPTELFVVGRTGVTAGSATMTVYGRLTAQKDSGLSATWDECMRFRGVNPLVRWEEQDTDVDSACRHWGLYLVNPSSDKAQMNWVCADDNSFTNKYLFLSAETRGGASAQYYVDYLFMNSGVEFVYGANGTDQVFCINAQGNTAPSSSNMLGLTNQSQLGAAGSAFSIVGASAGSARTSTGFLKIWVAGTARYVPFFDNYN